METIIVKPKNKEAIPFLKHLLTNLSDVASIKVVTVPGSNVAKSIDSGLKDAKDMLSGKKQGKTLKQLIGED
jgi:hypothetical protein